jgi:hypothetical protein
LPAPAAVPRLTVAAIASKCGCNPNEQPRRLKDAGALQPVM